jgi:hypothetical protein
MQGSVDGIEISSAASVAAVAAIAAATSSLETRRGSVSWPINRLSYDIVKEEELLQVEKFFVCRNDAPLLIKWLIQHKEKRNSFNKRLLVLSSFRILTLKYTPFQNRLRVTKDYKLIDLEQMEVFHSSVGSHTSIKCSFVNGRVLHVDPGIHCENFVRGIQRAIHTIRLAYHPTRLPSIQIPKELNWQEFFEESQDPFELLAIAYRACCDDLKISFRPSVLERLNECALNTPSVVDFQYCLQQGSNTPQQLLKETQALARALQNTTLFEGVIVRDCNVGDAGISAIMQSLELNNSLEGLVFSRVRLSKICLVALENAIKNHGAIPLLTMGNTGGCAGGLSGQGKKRLKHGQKASKIQLRRLDFSFNAFDNDMAVSLSNTFQTLTDGLQVKKDDSCNKIM